MQVLTDAPKPPVVWEQPRKVLVPRQVLVSAAQAPPDEEVCSIFLFFIFIFFRCAFGSAVLALWQRHNARYQALVSASAGSSSSRIRYK